MNALLADSRGFLWIGTTTGLSRFDGTAFKSYGVADGLPHAVINSLLEDRDGNIWVGTHAGLARMDARRHVISHIDLGHGSAANIGPLQQTRDGRISIAVADKLYVIPDERSVPAVAKVTLPPRSPLLVARTSKRSRRALKEISGLEH